MRLAETHATEVRLQSGGGAILPDLRGHARCDGQRVGPPRVPRYQALCHLFAGQDLRRQNSTSIILDNNWLRDKSDCTPDLAAARQALQCHNQTSQTSDRLDFATKLIKRDKRWTTIILMTEYHQPFALPRQTGCGERLQSVLAN